MAALFFHEMKYDVKEPRAVNADRFVLSKGHACPILYAAWEEAGLLSHDDVLSLRKIDSDIEGHPTPVIYYFIPFNRPLYSVSTSSTLPLARSDKDFLVLLEWPMLERTSTKLATACTVFSEMENPRKDLCGKQLLSRPTINWTIWWPLLMSIVWDNLRPLLLVIMLKFTRYFFSD